MKRHFYILTLIFITAANLLVAEFAFAQAPAITSFEPKKGSFGEIITINGSGFAPKADLKVTFGSAMAKITEANTTTIKVAVPAGASYASIVVTNLLPFGLSTQSKEPFLVSFGGQENGASTFDPFQKYPGSGVLDVCSCDFDGDGKMDLAGSNPNSTAVTTYWNSGSPGTITFAGRKEISAGIRTLYISCGDLNGDGKADLVFSGNGTDGEKVVILTNTSTTGNISFAPPQILLASQKVVGKPAIHDLDGDGKAEIILSDQANNQIIVFKNTSSVTGIAFEPEFQLFNVSLDFNSTLGLQIKDVNKDGLSDITASGLYGSKVFFLLNKSTKGNIDFQTSIELTVSNNISNHELEDMDGDGKMDLITTDIVNNQVNIHLNNSTGTSFSFSAPFPLTAGRPTGLHLGDLNGDKKFDLLVGNNNKAEAYGFINTSSPGKLSFSTVLFNDPLSSTGKFTNVQISDLDGDAKPDVVAGDRENGIFYTFRNLSCIFPNINPSGTVNICAGSSVILSTVQSPPSEGTGGGTPRLSYEWFKDNASVGSGYSLEVTGAGSYYVKMSSLEGCSASSAPVLVNMFNESLGNPTFDPVTASCEGAPLNLSVSPAIEGATYTWTNKITGFSTSTNTNTLSIPQAEAAIHSGIYKVSIVKQCQIVVESPEITIYPKTTAPSITVEESLSVCSGESRTLRAPEGFADYQWKKDGSTIPNAKSATFTATTAGTYTLLVKNANGCQAESGNIKLESSGNLLAAFEGPAIACVGQPVEFTNTSTWSSGKAVNYFWDFGDGNFSSSQSPTHTFNQLSTDPFSVSLTIEFEGTACKSVTTHAITVSTTPEITIEAMGPTEICAGDSVKVQLMGDISGANWSNGSTGLFTYAKEGGILQAEVLTTAGCTTTKIIEIISLAGPSLEVTADKTEIGRGESAALQAFGGISYIWEPAEGLNDPTIANPIASPDKSTTYKVKAMREYGCSTEGEITITVDDSFKVLAPKLFVPLVDQSWKVENIENYPEVSITIINKFGKTVFAASPYQNNWNGTDRGNLLNDGVYFYVFKDPSGNIVKSGSITLVR